jgi:lipopolysaccharide export system ATP-binding protein
MTGGNESAIAAADLAKRYGKTAALYNVSLQASAGTVTALLGPNGAGNPVTGLRRSSLAPQADFAYPVRGRLPGYVYRPSISDWQVLCRPGE